MYYYHVFKGIFIIKIQLKYVQIEIVRFICINWVIHHRWTERPLMHYRSVSFKWRSNILIASPSSRHLSFSSLTIFSYIYLSYAQFSSFLWTLHWPFSSLEHHYRNFTVTQLFQDKKIYIPNFYSLSSIYFKIMYKVSFVSTQLCYFDSESFRVI